MNLFSKFLKEHKKPKAYVSRLGSRYPTGALVDKNGTNFCIFSRHATHMELLLYDTSDSDKPFQTIVLDPEINRTFFFWHVYIEQLSAGIHYTWRVDGPANSSHGFHFNNKKELLDPWAKALTDTHWNRELASDPNDSSRSSMRAITVDDNYDWKNDQPLNHPQEDTIIYELHVGGFTNHISSGVKHPGTFAGVIEKIPYLKELGITDVELLPIMAFDEQDVPASAAALGLQNYWGYSTHSFHSPHPGYCVTPEQGKHLDEFRDMVKALHKAGIGIIMDVVFNHTAEGGVGGPVINFKGLANEMFYHLDHTDLSKYRDYSGCGNTVNCNHPLVTRFIVNCLDYWVNNMHVDGFRFDLASIFVRDENGTPMHNAPLPWSIEFSPALVNTKLIAEAWDAAGLYHVGTFPGFRWAEWNGRYRDAIRRFIKGEKGIINEVATCIGGSSDLYQHQGRLPINSINFVTCHDGFTLYDQVSYHQKHNDANGENNRDGHNDNHSWNCGHEGATDNIQIEILRRRQAKNFMAILLLSQGVPMILAGDEVLRTQRGNNNAYCQDNEISWFDWTLTEKNHGMLRFVKQMITFRKRHQSLRRHHFLSGKTIAASGIADVTWQGPRLDEPLWNDPDAQILCFTLSNIEPDEASLYVILNMSKKPIAFPLPDIKNQHWHCAIDTAQPSPKDILEPRDQIRIEHHSFFVKPRTVAVLESH